jgi:hypothetical protein
MTFESKFISSKLAVNYRATVNYFLTEGQCKVVEDTVIKFIRRWRWQPKLTSLLQYPLQTGKSRCLPRYITGSAMYDCPSICNHLHEQKKITKKKSLYPPGPWPCAYRSRNESLGLLRWLHRRLARANPVKKLMSSIICRALLESYSQGLALAIAIAAPKLVLNLLKKMRAKLSRGYFYQACICIFRYFSQRT